MAYTQVQGRTHDVSVAATTGVIGSGDGLTATTPGSELLVFACCNTKTRTFSSVVDSATNSGWVLIDQVVSSTTGSIIAWRLPGKSHVSSISGASAITITFSGSTTAVIGMIEAAGLDTSSGSVDNHVNDPTTDSVATTTYVMPALTPVAGDVMLFEAIGVGGAPTWTAPTGYTNQVTLGHSGASFAVSSKEIIGGGSQSPTYTANLSNTAGKIAFSIAMFIPPPRPIAVTQVARIASVW
jgi:hypothetical protein